MIVLDGGRKCNKSIVLEQGIRIRFALLDQRDGRLSKEKSFDGIVTAINMVAMGAGIAAAVIAADKSKAASADAARIEKRISEFTSDRLDIRVGEPTNVVFNVQNVESRAITDATVVRDRALQLPAVLVDRQAYRLAARHPE